MKHSARRKTPPQSNVVRVLLVESNPKLALQIQEYLSEARASRYVVRHVEQLGDALDLLPGGEFDLALFDVAPPEGGLDGLFRLRTVAAHLPIVLLCAPDAQRLALEGVGMGAQDFLTWEHVDAYLVEHAVLCAIERGRLGKAERREAETLRAETQRAISETILAESPVGIVLFDREMRITQLNAQYARIARLDPDTAKGQMIYDYFPGAGSWGSSLREFRPNSGREAMRRRALEGEEVDLPNIAQRDPTTGRTRYYDVYYRPVRDAGGVVTGVVGVVVDVTERHELERQKDDFLALASHELRTPVTSILGFAQLSARAAERLGDEKLARSLNIIKEQATHLSRIVNDVLDVSRLGDGGEMPLHRQRFNLSALVDDAARNLELAAPTVNVALDVPPTPVLVNADPYLIGEVVTNLLDNAVKYSRDGKRIEVEVRPNRKEAVTLVRDYGLGIPAGQQQRVFDRFYRASNASSLPRNGLGLGLFLAREIITRHGGRIWCESALEAGSTFYFTLPLV